MSSSASTGRLQEEVESGVGDSASVAVSVAAIDLDIALVDKDVREILECLQEGGEGLSYAGNSSATPEGRAFLERELDGLMVVKARYKEKKLARLQLQRGLPVVAVDWEIARVDAEVREVLGALQGKSEGSPYAGRSKDVLEKTLDDLMREKTEYKEKRLALLELQDDKQKARGSDAAEKPQQPAQGKTGSGAVAEVAIASPSGSFAEEETRSVSETTLAWTETVTRGTYDAPKRTAELYAPDAILWGTEVCGPDDDLWGTVSETVRDTPEQIYAYFDYFARLPELKVVEYTPAPVRVYGDFAAQAGSYTFSWQGTDGLTVEMRARFSFTFRRAGPSSPQPWTIVEHHSSSMPTSPLELELNQV
ncbi:unnamed protein product, partial [Ectocarpus sp. 12 AP-2014]